MISDWGFVVVFSVLSLLCFVFVFTPFPLHSSSLQVKREFFPSVVDVGMEFDRGEGPFSDLLGISLDGDEDGDLDAEEAAGGTLQYHRCNYV